MRFVRGGGQQTHDHCWGALMADPLARLANQFSSNKLHKQSKYR